MNDAERLADLRAAIIERASQRLGWAGEEPLAKANENFWLRVYRADVEALLKLLGAVGEGREAA